MCSNTEGKGGLQGPGLHRMDNTGSGRGAGPHIAPRVGSRGCAGKEGHGALLHVLA